EVIKQFEDKGCPYLDYSKSEAFAQMNAVPTAEGAIEIAMHNTDYILEGARVCVVGFGRIGQVLAKKLNSLGCAVTATARKDKDIEKIKALQLTPLDTGNLHTAGSFDIIFNTVPSRIFNENEVAAINKDCLIIELASEPYGTDFAACDAHKIRYINAGSLPGRISPKSAGIIICKTIIDIFKEENRWKT
ncbi:MAG: hypothetical protein IKY44_01665, partial [Clostridia bacterium]|nr:hypothetical protein [Clostridia bacterium]